MHGGWSHCIQGRGRKVAFWFSEVSLRKGTRVIQEMVRFFSASSAVGEGMLFSTLQATTQAWQAVHLSTSMTIPQRGMNLKSPF
jgi:hypothetical protein